MLTALLSPKSQALEVGDPVLISVNVTLKGVFPEVGEAVNIAARDVAVGDVAVGDVAAGDVAAEDVTAEGATTEDVATEGVESVTTM